MDTGTPPITLAFPGCETQAIHLLGEIQGHGVLLAADARSDIIRHVSRNAEMLLGRPAEALLGVALDTVLDGGDVAGLKARDLEPREPHVTAPMVCRVLGDAPEQRVACSAHRLGDLLVLELERIESGGFDDDSLLTIRDQTVEKLARPGDIEELLRNAAQVVRFLTGYDRVMVYRFHEDQHGEVVAESTDRPERLLGLHYPAIDIPPPARRHFRLNLVRLIADIEAPQSPVLCAETGRGAPEPLDLSHAKLRGVAPVHVAYMANMGVRGSLSLSLIVNGELWGLVACHHYAPKTLTPALVHVCEILAMLIASFIDRITKSDHLEEIVRAETLSQRLDSAWQEGRALAEAVADEAAAIRGLLGASFLLASIDGRRIVDGDAPERLPDPAALRAKAADGLLMSDYLGDVVPVEYPPDPLCAGGVFFSLGPDEEDFIFLCRPAIETVLTWNAPEEKLAESLRRQARQLNPIASMAVWRETIAHRAEAFTMSQQVQASILRRALVGLRQREKRRHAEEARLEAERSQARLQRELLQASRLTSLNELGAAVAHELNQPLTATMNYISASRRLLSRRPESAAEALELLNDAGEQAKRAGMILRRVRELIEQGDIEQQEVDVAALVRTAVDTALSPEDDGGIEISYEIAPKLPIIQGDRVQLEQLVFNLVKNALEAMAGREIRRLRIAIEIEAPGVAVAIADSGPGLSEEIADRLFQPFCTTKPNGMGIGLSLCRTIVEAHGGRIAAESSPDGAVFRFVLPRMPD